MANQLCHSAETNHCIAESITVSHGNTSPRVPLFITQRASLRLSAAETGDGSVFGARTLAARSGWSGFFVRTVVADGLERSHLNRP